ncbi:hypothetical protein C2G38_1972392 [Gigaspora rosea]|uniref:CsbD-like domain-containing protein n=1 Tax=Gigaspora rosea TaxID=44941 RepID=A0A397V1R3_9GLOM|nr:hypothetical protein C2G38_1972392 [Gigaspora rosea]
MSEEPSKVNANVNYYTGAAKETLGNVVGSESLKASGQAAQIRGNAEYDAASQDAPSKLTGNYNAAAGAVKETIGSAIGHTELEKSGAEQRRKGNEELEAAKMSDYIGGAGTRVKGSVKEQVNIN